MQICSDVHSTAAATNSNMCHDTVSMVSAKAEEKEKWQKKQEDKPELWKNVQCIANDHELT